MSLNWIERKQKRYLLTIFVAKIIDDKQLYSETMQKQVRVTPAL